MTGLDFETFSSCRGWIQGIDPRLRLLTAAAASVVAVASRHPLALLAMLTLWLAVGFSIRLPLRAFAKRLLALNSFMLVLLIVMPLSVGGPEAFALGGAGWSWPGIVRALTIAVRGNIILLIMTTLVSTISLARLGHELGHLRVPPKLVQMLLFSARYHSVLLDEYHRLLRAMRVRGFAAGINRHTYRSMGQLIGMLLVRSVDRSERILAAMRCRGYSGRIHLLDHFSLRRRDLCFSALAVAMLASLAVAESAPLWP